MVTGGNGTSGHRVPRPVEMERKHERDTATTQRHIMEDTYAAEMTQKLPTVLLKIVQVLYNQISLD